MTALRAIRSQVAVVNFICDVCPCSICQCFVVSVGEKVRSVNGGRGIRNGTYVLTGAAYCFGRQQLTQDVTAAMGAWRRTHRTAPLREIEVELAARRNRLRARRLGDLALTS